MRNTSKSKRIAIFVLALFFSLAFLLPIGFVIVHAEHMHVCSDGHYEDACAGNKSYICCRICIDIYNAKGFIMSSAASNTGIYSAFLWLIVLHSILRSVYIYTGPSSLISLKVRLNN